MRGRGIAAPHRKREYASGDPNDVPTVHFDYCFMGEKAQTTEAEEEEAWAKSEDKLKILTVKLGGL